MQQEDIKTKMAQMTDPQFEQEVHFLAETKHLVPRWMADPDSGCLLSDYMQACLRLSRCYGQLDGINMLVQQDGDLVKTLQMLDTELQAAMEQMKALQEKAEAFLTRLS